VWPVIGHEWAVDLLQRSVQGGRFSHAYLFVGPSQVGKTTLARALAQAVNCQAEDAPCGVCRSCRLAQADRHPDVSVIAPEKDRIKIEAVREMQRTITLAPVEGRYRVCVLSHMDLATPSAANCLLKTLEEPPPRVMLILTAERVDLLLPTLVSRCQVLILRPLPTAQIVSALEARGVESDRARLLGCLAGGRIGWALEASQDGDALKQRDSIIGELQELVQGSCTMRFAWAERLSKRPELVPGTLSVWASLWHDVLLLVWSSGAQITNVDCQALLGEWAARYNAMAVQNMLRSIRDTVWRLEQNANPRLALEVLTLDMPGAR
jgi:DNA polymerase-3 subunit delta'